MTVARDELYELLHSSTLNINNYNHTVFYRIVDSAMSKDKTRTARYYTETLLNRLSDFLHELADIINSQEEDGWTVSTVAALPEQTLGQASQGQ